MTGPAAILDIDGTLVDSNYFHAVAWYRAMVGHGHHSLPMWRIHRAIGMGSDQLIGALLGDDVEEREGDDIRATEKERYFELIEEVRPLDGARELADAWTTSGDVERTKPYPDLVNAALKRAGGGPAVMVGDSVWDCKAAENAGVDTVAVLTGGFSDSELLKAGAVVVFPSIQELRRRLSWTPLG